MESSSGADRPRLHQDHQSTSEAMRKPPYSVFLYTDNKILRQATQALLADSSMVRFVGDLHSEDRDGQVERLRPNVIVMDMLDTEAGFKALNHFSKVLPDTKSVVFIDKLEGSAVTRAFKEKATGVLSRSDADKEMLEEAIKKVAGGEIFLPQKSLQAFLKYTSQQNVKEIPTTGNKPEELSDRQIQVRDLVIEGWSDKAIATALSVSPRTIKSHINNICDKYGISSEEGNRRIVLCRLVTGLDSVA